MRERDQDTEKDKSLLSVHSEFLNFCLEFSILFVGYCKRKLKMKKKNGGESLRTDTSQLDLVSSKNY